MFQNDLGTVYLKVTIVNRKTIFISVYSLTSLIYGSKVNCGCCILRNTTPLHHRKKYQRSSENDLYLYAMILGLYQVNKYSLSSSISPN